MINNSIDLPIVPIKSLPFYMVIDKRTEWYSLLPEVMNIQYKWIFTQKEKLELAESIKPYFDYAFQLWRDTVVIAGNNYNYFAVHSLRAILERIALVYSSSSNFEININDIINSFESNVTGVRVSATQTIMEYAENLDKDFKLLYDLLSRYFGHVSNLDLVRINEELKNSELLSIRSQMIPLLLIIEVGNCIINCMTLLLEEQDKIVPSVTGGRKPHFSYSIKQYVRVSTYVMCEKHSRKSGVEVRTLCKNINGITGDIGFNDIYRGGMELMRFGKPEDKPEIKEIAGLGIFAIGRGKDEHIKVKVIKEHHNGEIYELSWPKQFEIDGMLLGIISGDNKVKEVPLFDFLNGFIEIVLRN